MGHNVTLTYIYILKKTKNDGVEWILIGRGGRHSSVGRHRFMNLGQTTVRCSPTSPVATGGLNQPGETVTLYQQETERGNEMVRRSWYFPLSVFYVCVRTWLL